MGPKMSGQRILALDVGERRIGVAVSDPTGLLATPLKAIDRTRSPSAVSEIIRLVEEYEACEIVVGMPISLSGRSGTQVQRANRFVDTLADQTSVPVVLRDERYTSVQAERLLRAAGRQPSRDKGRVDSAAAALILQSHLDSKRTGSG
jgi:putative Holliday junction resolvase